MPAGNLMLACGIFFSGSSAVRCINMLRHLNIPTISVNTHNLMQSSYLVPATRRVWFQERGALVQAREATGYAWVEMFVVVPRGHTAKFGSYTLIDHKASKVLDMRLLQVCYILF